MSNAMAEVRRARKALAKAERDLGGERARRRILCSCGKYHAINSLELIVTHFYVDPYGCTDGDYWVEGEWQFLCPRSGMRNRLMFDDYKVKWDKRDQIGVAGGPTFKHLYRGLFKSSEDVHERRNDNSPFRNNYYVDQNRKRFGLPPSIPERGSNREGCYA
jgi:hypothetical protein